MWPKIESSDKCYYYPEPIEVRNLKHKLASLSCKCRTCKKTNTSTTVFLQTQKNQQVQAQESQKKLFNQYTQANSQSVSNAHDVFMNTITKDVLCPSCFITMNLLRGGILRVLKDEEVETNQDMFNSKTSTGQNVKVTDKSTSFFDNAHKCSTLIMCDILSEVSSEYTLNMSPHDKQHQVKFMDADKDSRKFDPCLCLDKFMDSIRPPLGEFLFE